MCFLANLECLYDFDKDGLVMEGNPSLYYALDIWIVGIEVFSLTLTQDKVEYAAFD
jgi:hypothetical protein